MFVNTHTHTPLLLPDPIKGTEKKTNIYGEGDFPHNGPNKYVCCGEINMRERHVNWMLRMAYLCLIHGKGFEELLIRVRKYYPWTADKDRRSRVAS